MIENLKLYKEISLRIVEMLKKNDVSELDILLNKRQDILDKESNIEEFKNILINNGILEIDNMIHILISSNMDKVKNEIREHRLSKQANNSYMCFNRENLNIFSKKV